VRDADGSWRRARPGDGAAEALLKTLATAPETSATGSFTVHAWSSREAVGERAVTVDQTNESVIVGEAAVVKWATHLQPGPHPAPRRIEVLRANEFRFMPRPWGLVTWRTDDGDETLVVNVDEYLPGAVDGWTWAVDLFADAARYSVPSLDPLLAASVDVGTVVAELHAALATTATTASQDDAHRWWSAALGTLNQSVEFGDSVTAELLRQRRPEIEQTLRSLSASAGTRLIEGHGDLHVGQVLQHAGGYVVTDFDGNPVLPPDERVLPVPASLDVAGLAQSLTHAAIVARRHHEVVDGSLAVAERAARQAFVGSYVDRLTVLGHAGLYDPAPLRAFRLQQVLREIIYAAQHLPRWMYVPAAALPLLLDEGIASAP
jgi:maltokinase